MITIKANLEVVREDGEVFISRQSLLQLFADVAEASDNNPVAIAGTMAHAILGAEEGGKAIMQFTVPLPPEQSEIVNPQS